MSRGLGDVYKRQELAESVELLSRDTLYKAAVLEQVTHLTDAVQNLKAV